MAEEEAILRKRYVHTVYFGYGVRVNPCVLQFMFDLFL